MKTKVLILFFLLLTVGQCFYIFNLTKELKAKNDLAVIEQYEQGKTTILKQDEEISSLKKINRELYDSIKSFKDEITFLSTMSYRKVYVTDTVYVKEEKKNEEVRTFEYSDNSDSLSYVLKIGSVSEPNWYKLNLKVNDEFTIINRNNNGLNKTTIESTNGASFNDVVVINQSKKKKFLEKFDIAPSVGFGYGLIQNRFDVYVGVSVTYDF